VAPTVFLRAYHRISVIHLPSSAE